MSAPVSPELLELSPSDDDPAPVSVEPAPVDPVLVEPLELESTPVGGGAVVLPDIDDVVVPESPPVSISSSSLDTRRGVP